MGSQRKQKMRSERRDGGREGDLGLSPGEIARTEIWSPSQGELFRPWKRVQTPRQTVWSEKGYMLELPASPKGLLRYSL